MALRNHDRRNHAGGVEIMLANASVERGGVKILSDVSLTSRAGEIIALIGANGAGKTTLLSAMAGLVPLSAGSCSCLERDGSRAAQTRIGYVLQKPIMLRRSVGGNLDFAMAAAAVPRKQRKGLKNQLLEMMQIAPLEHNSAYRLSQGEAQRLAVARVLAMQPGLLMMDEATNSLDQMSCDLLERHIRKQADNGLAIFWVTHSLKQAERMADRVICLDEGRIISDSTADEFFR